MTRERRALCRASPDHKSTCVKDPADHTRQHDAKERQNLQVRSQQGAAFSMCQGLSSQRSLHNHLQNHGYPGYRSGTVG